MFGFHLWDVLVLVFFLGIVAIIVSVVVWATRRPTRVMFVPMNMQPPYPQPPYQGPGQPGPQPPYPGQPPAHYPPQ